MKQVLFPLISLLSVLLLTFISCDTNEPPTEGSLTLKLEDVSCTEAWISLTTSNIQLPVTVTIKQNNQTKSTINLVKADTLLYIDSLLPNQTYQYQAESNENPATSNELNVTTMDTTSHDFTFETFTFGGTAGTSTLFDCAIISPENIWAVGEILVADTSQNGYTMYNAVHWNGIEWNLKKITVEFRSNFIVPPLEGVFAFSNANIWFVGSLPIHGDGQNWVMYDLRTTLDPNITLLKAWGANTNNIYFVGRNGNIVHYNGTNWRQIESGTDLNINDIWGIPDGNGGYNKYLAADNAMLKINANNSLTRIDAEQGMIIISVWGISNRLIYTAGDGVVLYKNNNWEKIDRPDVNTIYRIRGQNFNYLFGISSLGTILHFDGYSWNSINIPVENILLKLDVKDNVIAGVGWQGEKAAITIIKRNN